MRRLVVVAAVSMATGLAVAVLWSLRDGATLFAISLAVSAALRPAVEAVERRLGRAAALTVVYVGGLGVAGALLALASRGLFSGVLAEVDEGLERLGAAYDRLRVGWAGASLVPGVVLRRMPPAAALYRLIGGAHPAALWSGVLGLTLNAIDLVSRFLIVIALSAFWSARREAFERLWLSLLAPRARTRARDVWRAVEREVGAHVRSELGLSLLAFLLVGAVFRAAALPTPTLPALAAGLFRLVPFFGAVAAAGIAYLAGAALTPAVGALAATFTLLLLLLDRWLARRLFRARLPSPTLVVFLIVALGGAYGVFGLIAASPLAAGLQALVGALIATHPRRGHHARSLAEIQARIARVRQRLLLVAPEKAAQLGSVVARLEALAIEARRVTERAPRDPPVTTSSRR
jgi:predicted PurR-regulated permease PerM